MKYHFLIAGLLFSACSEKTEEKAAHQVEFNIRIADTLFVDPGNEILYLQSNLSHSQLSDDSRYLYNFDLRNNSLEIIDLDHLRIVKKVPFEKEGPNGTGGNLQNMYYGGENNILLSEYHQVGLFDISGNKLHTHKILRQDYTGDTLLSNESLSTTGVLDDKAAHFVTFYSQGFGEPLGIAKVRLEDYYLTKIPVSALRDLVRFRVAFSDGEGTSAAYPSSHVSKISGKILLSNRAVNEVVIFDPSTDSVKQITFQSNLTPNSRKETLGINVNSEAEFSNIIEEINKDVSFGHPTFDSKNHRYYRFSHAFMKESTEKNIFQPLLTVFDQDFNQLFETDELPIKKAHWRYFAKDGKLYLYENIMDEMAFIVLEIEEKNQ